MDSLALPRFDSFVQYVDHYAATRPADDAVWFEGRIIDYASLQTQVDAFAGALASAGVGAGDRVAVLSTPRPEFLISLLAAQRLGAVWVGLNPRYSQRELAHVVHDSQPRVIVALADFEGREYASDVAALREQVAGACATYRLDRGPATGVLAPLPVPVPAAVRATPPEADAAAVIVYTSGSSGAPKGAVLSNRGLVMAARRESEVLGVQRPRVPCNLPVNHIACIVDLCGTTLLAGGMIALLERFDPAGLLEAIARLRLTNLMNVPTVLQALAMMPEFERADLGSLRTVVWGGAPLPVDVIRAYRRRGIGLMTVYGMTETIASITFTDPDATDEQLATTVGRPDPELQVRLADDQDRPVAAGVQGEVQVRDAGLFLEYHGRPEATAQAFTQDGWFRTGDLGVIRKDGNLRLVGRRSDMFKSGGYNIYPREIELCLEEHPDVDLAVVVARADETYGEVGVAFVLSASGTAPTGEDVRTFCRTRLANYKIPKDVVVVDEIPLLPVGKVDRQELRRRAAAVASIGSASSHDL